MSITNIMADAKKRVLVADDDTDIRGIISSSISILDLEVFEACDGEEAVRIAAEKNIDLAVLDYMMPGKDGIQACREIKAATDGQYIPVILLTARDALTDKVKALQEGIDDYLTKPFNYEELQARVKVQLRLRDLNLNLKLKNDELKKAQTKIIEQERQLLATQLAGTTSHNLGQPLSAIILNCHLLEKLSFEDKRFLNALASIKSDTRRMVEIIEKLKVIDANATNSYFGQTAVLSVESKDS
jgi:DNA-binding response OmpR family regulator